MDQTFKFQKHWHLTGLHKTISRQVPSLVWSFWGVTLCSWQDADIQLLTNYFSVRPAWLQKRKRERKNYWIHGIRVDVFTCTSALKYKALPVAHWYSLILCYIPCQFSVYLSISHRDYLTMLRFWYRSFSVQPPPIPLLPPLPPLPYNRPESNSDQEVGAFRRILTLLLLPLTQPLCLIRWSIKVSGTNSHVPVTCLAVWWWLCAGGWHPWWSRQPGCGRPRGTLWACLSLRPESWSSWLDLWQQISSWCHHLPQKHVLDKQRETEKKKKEIEDRQI